MRFPDGGQRELSKCVGRTLFPPILYTRIMNIIQVQWREGTVESCQVAAKQGYAKLRCNLLECVALGRSLFAVECNRYLDLPVYIRFKNIVAYAKTQLTTNGYNFKTQHE